MRYNKIILDILILLLFVCYFPLKAKTIDNQIVSEFSPKKLTINLICYKNDLGLSQDVEILQTELSKLGHSIIFVNIRDLRPPALKADINIFVDVVEEFFFPFASKNYLMPNAEWCFLSADKIAQFDMILCKTKETQRIFNPLNSHVVYLGFTSKDRFIDKTRKNYYAPFHLAGGSIQKGTYALVKTWLENPQFPSLILIKHKDYCYPSAPNIHLVNKYLTDSALAALQNCCGLHFCTSETEGFGHYIMEALSCGAVVVTTDAPPMNEFVFDKRCLVNYHRTEPMRWATNYYIDPLKLEKVIFNLLSLPFCELEEIGKKNREFYLESNRLFKQRLAEIFPSPFSVNAKLD